jgi:alkylhydroperoxidase family enzyme
VAEPLFAEVRRQWSEAELVELTASIAAYNMVARLLVALEVENEAR